jgi:iron complex transport system substrate-binding protein
VSFSFPALVILVSGMCACAVSSAADVERIVSLAPNLTELAFAAGAGSRVVGTVEFSDYPEAARTIARVGDAFRVDFERVVALRPDAVLTWEPGTPPGVVQRLAELHLNVVTIATYNVADVARGLRSIGALAGTQDAAEKVAVSYEREIEQLRADFSRKAPVTVFLQINDRPLYTVNGRQIMSEVLALCGGRNVFAELNELAPQISVEAVIARNPQVILSTGDSQPESLSQWQRWKTVTAVRSNNLYQVSADDLARATPRLATGAQTVCRTLETARQRLGKLQSPAQAQH